jgi:hypothetical protein
MLMWNVGRKNEKGRRVDPSGLGEVLDVGV